MELQLPLRLIIVNSLLIIKEKTPVVVNISIDDGKNTFADDVKYKDKNNKKATVKLTITPTKKWNNQEN